MVTVEVKIEKFKSDCESYYNNIKLIVDCDEKLELLNHKLKGIKSVTPKGNEFENCGDPYKERKNEILTEIFKVEDEKKSLEFANNRVDKFLVMIQNPLDRNMVRDRHVEQKHHEKIARTYSYNDISAVDKHITSVLKKLFKDN